MNRFARKYLLPCRHVFQLDAETKVLTPERWQLYVSMFSESGFEVYETLGHVMVDKECAPHVDSIRVRSVLQLRELEERLRQQLYSIHEIIDETNIETTEHGAIVENWMNLVTSTVEPDRCIARRDS